MVLWKGKLTDQGVRPGRDSQIGKTGRIPVLALSSRVGPRSILKGFKMQQKKLKKILYPLFWCAYNLDSLWGKIKRKSVISLVFLLSH